jgi:riboflavin kinase/FMN adenylyltransferase
VTATTALVAAARQRPPAAIRHLESAERYPRRVAVGKFDGVHLGHQTLLEGCDAVITFDRHPLRLLRPDRAPKRLSTLEQRAELVGGIGVEQLIVLAFDHGLAGLSAQEFVAGVLIEQLGVSEVAVGEGFRFGRGMEGDVALLQTYDEFATRVVPLLHVAGEPVSSSRIRTHLIEGDLRSVAALLGRPYAVRARVHPPGGGADRRTSVPAAVETDVLLPAPGLYRCVVNAARGAWPPRIATATVAPAAPGGEPALELRLRGPLPAPPASAVDVAFLHRAS